MRRRSNYRGLLALLSLPFMSFSKGGRLAIVKTSAPPFPKSQMIQFRDCASFRPLCAPSIPWRPQGRRNASKPFLQLSSIAVTFL